MARLTDAQETSLITATLIRGGSYVLIDPVAARAAALDPQRAAHTKPLASFTRNKPLRIAKEIAEYLSGQFEEVDVEVEPGIIERRSVRRFKFEPAIDMPPVPEPKVMDRRTPEQRARAAEIAELSQE